MTMIADQTFTTQTARAFSRQTVWAWMSAHAEKRRLQRQARAAARSFAHHSNAELADIGLTRDDITQSGVDHAIDRQMHAMMRITL